jgi:hypothetical protein
MAPRLCLLLGGLALLGCSGAASSEILDPVPSTSANDPAPSGNPPASGTTKGPAATDDKGGRGGSGLPGPEGPRTDPQANPQATCMAEVEGNESAAKATTFTSCIAGTIAGSKDNDFVRIVAPPEVRRMKVSHKEGNGRVLYQVTKENSFLPLLEGTMFSDEEPEIRITPGEAYVFRISPMGGMSGPERNERSWEISVRFDD